jgi:hypothetical protein
LWYSHRIWMPSLATCLMSSSDWGTPLYLTISHLTHE